jgi:hypothetical protein
MREARAAALVVNGLARLVPTQGQQAEMPVDRLCIAANTPATSPAVAMALLADQTSGDAGCAQGLSLRQELAVDQTRVDVFSAKLLVIA